MKGKVWIYLLRGVLIFFAMIGAGIFMVCRTTTMVNPWIVATVAVPPKIPENNQFPQPAVARGHMGDPDGPYTHRHIL